MAIFGDSGKKPATSATAPARGNTPGSAGLSIIGLGMTVHGDLETAGVVKIEGTVNGHVTAGQQVLVAKGGQIDGDVDTGEAVVGGSVHGAVSASLRVEIQAGAVIHGDVTTKRISVAEGAVLNGAIRMSDIEEPSAPASSRGDVPSRPALPSLPVARPAAPPRAEEGQ